MGADRRLPSVCPVPQSLAGWVSSLAFSFPFREDGGESVLLDKVFPVPEKLDEDSSAAGLVLG